MSTPKPRGRPFEKGRARTGGRAKGSPNKVTRDTKEVMRLLAQNLTPELEQWIRVTARYDKEKAARLLMTALEFTQPKLQRTEMTGLDGAALEVSLNSGDAKL